MTDHKNMTPEEEAKLVPDWVHYADGDQFSGQYGVTYLKRAGLGLYMQDVGPAYVADLFPALAFFAATGRLPRRPND